ncbi:hypothetical protein MML48_2g00003614 [Holotrichia oblita]|uniref:Uncharacterized protein n=1 Tax=Holotrichia oblita TaxID=644536 RepID=A0ACB9TQW0_HOLOL|nr:hypothetical protein MML48_2g00003614 [Holotrichia oblita]
MTCHTLKTLSDHDLIKLRDIYEKHLPYATHVYNLISTYMKWKKLKDGGNYMKFLSLSDDWSTTGTFIMQFSCYDIFVFTLQKNGADLYKALTDTRILNVDGRVVLYGILNDHYPTVLKSLIYKNITKFHTIEMMLYYLPKEKALSITVVCPDNVYVDKLCQLHIPTITAIWPHRFDGAERYLSIFLEMNGGYGVFLKEDDKLVAWVMRNHWGTMINLQTLPEYKRMGFGHLIVSVMAKHIAEDGQSPMATIVMGNFASEMLFQKLGFRHLNSLKFVTLE